MYLSKACLYRTACEPAGGDDHRLGPAADLVPREVAEVLDHDLGLLGDVVRVQAHEARQRRAPPCACRPPGRPRST